MVVPGKYNTLLITKIVDFGVFLDGEEHGEILLPMKWVPENTRPDDKLEVFLYFDSEDRLIATTMKPHAVVGDFAFLKVVAVNEVGAFLDWGLEKDLLLPYREQTYTVIADNFYPVYVFSDKKGRIAASMDLNKYIDKDTSQLNVNQEVDLMIYAATDLGFKAIINNRFEGVLYANEIFRSIARGERTKGYIKKVRDDGRIDLTLYKVRFEEKIDALNDKILTVLREHNGFLPLNDNSLPEEIYNIVGISKKNFKKAIGSLYKAGRITISDKGINLAH